MSSRDDSMRVLVAMVLIGAFLITLIHYGCSRVDEEIPNQEPLPLFLR